MNTNEPTFTLFFPNEMQHEAVWWWLLDRGFQVTWHRWTTDAACAQWIVEVRL